MATASIWCRCPFSLTLVDSCRVFDDNDDDNDNDNVNENDNESDNDSVGWYWLPASCFCLYHYPETSSPVTESIGFQPKPWGWEDPL